MTNEELDKWFDDLSYEDKCAALYCLGDNTYSIKELKEMYDTPEDMLEDTYGRRTFEPNQWYDSDLEDKQYVYDFFKKEKENDAIATNTPPKKTRTELKEACIAAFEKAVKNPIKGTIYGEDDYHAWNIVKIGNESYHVDVTWDNLYDGDLHHISYDYFNVTTKDILLDHEPMGNLPKCDATRLNYFHSTHSFVSTYEELVRLIDQRFGEKEIAFKASTNKGNFWQLGELKDETIKAMMHVMAKKNSQRSFALLFNEKHNIGKILFV